MNRMLRIGLAIFVIYSTGCGSLKQQMYESPISGDVAYIRLLDKDGLPFPKNSISAATYAEPETCTRRSFLLHYFQDPSLNYVKIKAGEPFSMSVHFGASDGLMNTTCIPVINFIPEAGRYYTAQFVYSRSEGSCYLPLKSSDSPSAGPFRIEKPRAMIFSNGFTENSSFCKAK